MTTESVRLLVCGSRYWKDREYLNRLLDKFLVSAVSIEAVIEGEALGADSMARDWAKSRGVAIESYPADWNQHGKAAGSIRNRQMLTEGKPTHVIAFTMDLGASRGTKNMVTMAQKAGLPVFVLPYPGAFWA